MKKAPKKLRKILRNLPRAKKIQGHRHEIAKAYGRLDRNLFHYAPYRPYGGRW